jgi:hypothetical protein
VSVGTRGLFPELPGLRMSKSNSGCRCVVLRIVLAIESILAHRRSVMQSSTPFEPRWREASRHDIWEGYVVIGIYRPLGNLALRFNIKLTCHPYGIPDVCGHRTI